MQKKGSERKNDQVKSIYLPGEAIKSLRSELSNLLGEKLASGALFRFGYRCGEAFAERNVQEEHKEKGIDEELIKIWGKTGLGKIVSIEDVSEDEVIIEQEDSTEAKAIGGADQPSCDYTRGYLAGIANLLSKKKFYCVETECMAEGKNRCHFQLVEFPHKVYVTKKSP